MPVSTVAIPVGQWLVSPEGVRWWFDSGSFALDFATTGPLGQQTTGGTAGGTAGDTAGASVGGAPGDAPGGAAGGAPAAHEQLHAPDDLTEWLRERFPVQMGAARSRDLFDAVALRDAIARMARSAARGEDARGADIDVVNLYAATPDIPPTLAGGTRQAGRSVHTVSQALATIARDAVDVFSPDNAGRLRECDGADCTMVYLDTSRAATRRWCSMQRCGNRAKVRAHRARKAGNARAAAPDASAAPAAPAAPTASTAPAAPAAPTSSAAAVSSAAPAAETATASTPAEGRRAEQTAA
ncbi:putative RNA-binding Zn ribbon-like protein [Agromyces terreus]|uniref:RNA-binding Zn ribbon-like protein n=1 Tax=Agromyces terreus TaxID=424795 RepID=A0A9X2H144_9MICO|nr:CGNR zinc finger domain-containing protein [Agromyces terreus]MCP2371068.1 putative RNA-binding Zn ribbon-like protein [Agromyces terreus]